MSQVSAAMPSSSSSPLLRAPQDAKSASPVSVVKSAVDRWMATQASSKPRMELVGLLGGLKTKQLPKGAPQALWKDVEAGGLVLRCKGKTAAAALKTARAGWEKLAKKSLRHEKRVTELLRRKDAWIAQERVLQRRVADLREAVAQ